MANLGDFRFENGAVVRDFKVSYVTHGKPSPKKDNAILLMHHFYGDHHAFDFLIGPGKAFDPDKYFIVASDFLGNANVRPDITTGPTNSRLRMDFPHYTIRDEVSLEYRLLKDYLGLEHVVAVAGISVGAMKAYQFAVSYPTYVGGFIPIMGSPVRSMQRSLTLNILRELIEVDAGWYGGKYDRNSRVGVDMARFALFPVLYTPQWWTAMKTVEDYRQWRSAIDDFIESNPNDARDYYYALQAWADFDIGIRRALKAIRPRLCGR
jgi:homoserine O-acetyltransferase